VMFVNEVRLIVPTSPTVGQLQLLCRVYGVQFVFRYCSSNYNIFIIWNM